MSKGFTLLELIIVVIIVAILAGLGIPQFLKVVERAKASEAVNVLGSIRGSELRYYAEHGGYTALFADLDINAVTGLKNFNAPVMIGTPAAVASMQKSSGIIYTITMAPDGTLSCAPPASCPKL
ncbi:MAG: prepilin-type N-terminal cleavage/methylation domain-containing protein [Candidatus Omnitrophica bacterium]|nr:prepilin-type N-terminal cleavage/methylation domain-containing protein [Candidatus Omnitrophota bacterium]